MEKSDPQVRFDPRSYAAMGLIETISAMMATIGKQVIKDTGIGQGKPFDKEAFWASFNIGPMSKETLAQAGALMGVPAEQLAEMFRKRAAEAGKPETAMKAKEEAPDAQPAGLEPRTGATARQEAAPRDRDREVARTETIREPPPSEKREVPRAAVNASTAGREAGAGTEKARATAPPPSRPEKLAQEATRSARTSILAIQILEEGEVRGKVGTDAPAKARRRTNLASPGPARPEAQTENSRSEAPLEPSAPTLPENQKTETKQGIVEGRPVNVDAPDDDEDSAKAERIRKKKADARRIAMRRRRGTIER